MAVDDYENFVNEEVKALREEIMDDYGFNEHHSTIAVCLEAIRSIAIDYDRANDADFHQRIAPHIELAFNQIERLDYTFSRLIESSKPLANSLPTD